MKAFTQVIKATEDEQAVGMEDTIINYTEAGDLELYVGYTLPGIGLTKREQIELRDILLKLHPVHVVQKDY